MLDLIAFIILSPVLLLAVIVLIVISSRLGCIMENTAASLDHLNRIHTALTLDMPSCPKCGRSLGRPKPGQEMTCPDCGTQLWNSD